jgi:hypothetical protein
VHSGGPKGHHACTGLGYPRRENNNGHIHKIIKILYLKQEMNSQIQMQQKGDFIKKTQRKI